MSTVAHETREDETQEAKPEPIARGDYEKQRREAQRELQRRVDSFEMPPVKLFQRVRWFEKGQTTGRVLLGYIVDIGAVAHSIVVEGHNLQYDSVRHINDPKLVQNPNLALDDGAWDYTEEEIEAERKERELNDRLNRIEAAITELAKALPAKTPAKKTGKQTE